MLFVSNNHILLKLRGGKTITLLPNGSIVHQESKIQEMLEDSEYVIGESQMYRGRKTLLFEDQYGDSNEHLQHVTMQFTQDGAAKLVGVFQDYA